MTVYNTGINIISVAAYNSISITYSLSLAIDPIQIALSPSATKALTVCYSTKSVYYFSVSVTSISVIQNVIT
jgi:hypothetical protein